MYSFRRERVETNYLRPRFTDEEGHKFKALVNVTNNKGHLCWGIVDENDNYVMPNQQLTHNPWGGKPLPQTVEELKAVIRGQ